MNTLLIFLIALLIIVSIGLILIILMQRPQGGGLASAFGGAGGASSDTVFGGRVGDALTWMTVAGFIVYLILSITLNLVDSTDPSVTVGTVEQQEEGVTTVAPSINEQPGSSLQFDAEESVTKEDD